MGQTKARSPLTMPSLLIPDKLGQHCAALGDNQTKSAGYLVDRRAEDSGKVKRDVQEQARNVSAPCRCFGANWTLPRLTSDSSPCYSENWRATWRPPLSPCRH